MSYTVEKADDFIYIHRILNTNIDGKRRVPFALRAIRGIGRRFAFILCKAAGIDVTKRAGQLSNAEVEQLTKILEDPEGYHIPLWLLNRRNDFKDGKNYHLASNSLDTKFREDIERLKKIRSHRGLRHYWGLKVRGQHTKTTGRNGISVGVERKK